MLAGDEVRNIVHRPRTIEGVHRDEVLEDRRLQLAKIFLHTCRLKLECAGCLSRAIKFVGFFVVDRHCIYVHVDAARLLYVGESLFYYR